MSAKRFQVMVAVDVIVKDESQLRSLWNDLKEHGCSMDSTDGSHYSIRCDKLTLKQLKTAYHGQG